MRDELSKAMDEFQAIGACGIVMDVRTGEVIAMVSLPDYDANQFGEATAGRAVQPRGDRHVRAGQHVQAADRGDGAGLRRRRISGTCSTRRTRHPYRPLHHHRLRGQAPLALSAGGARLLLQPRRRAYRRSPWARERQRAWLQAMGMFSRVGIELPEAGLPIVPPAANWKEVDDHDGRLRPRHRGLAAACRARHRGGRQWRHRCCTPTILAQPTRHAGRRRARG